jgi:glycerophosphoryl diester phosphodiesterase
MEEKLLSQAREHGYSGSKAAIFVQSFEPEALQRLRAAGSELPQVLLLGDEAAFSRWVNEKGLQEAASFADGIGPNKSLLAKHPEAVERTHAAGFVLHPWTFRDDQLPTGASTPEEELQKYLVELKVDGVFTDFPDTAAAFVREHFANDLVGDE